MPDDIAIPGPSHSSAPFTAAGLREIVNHVLKAGQTRPGWSDLEHLATSLNLIHGAFTFATKTANKSHAAAKRVREALETLILFFEERRQECFPEKGPSPAAQIIESEKRLYDQFHSFLRGLDAHDFQLDMDAGALMPQIDGWRQLAEVTASAFKAAMSRSNGARNLGLSNDGPVPRFVAAVMPLMTGETPSVLNVGKHLKDQARKHRQRTGTVDD